ncbi:MULTISPECIES: hypothetical protein [unclassified Streptomyces]|uniref:hypothetical protein n=1 Tax=unclassified Streptomyces TaxID=2593676 RepID=UPI003659DBDC
MAAQNALPQLVRPEALGPGNSAMVSLMAAGSVAGGVLVQLLGAPVVLVCAAVGHLGSGLRLIRMERGDAAEIPGMGDGPRRGPSRRPASPASVEELVVETTM